MLPASIVHFLTQIAKLLWPRSGQHQARSSGPHTAWNDGVLAVRSRLPDLGTSANGSGPPERHHSMQNVGQMNVSGTMLLSGMNIPMSDDFFLGVFFRSPVKRPSQPVRAFPALRERESDKCGNTARKKRSVVVGARFSSSFA